VLKFGIVDGISELIMLFGTFAISAGCTGLGFWLIKLMVVSDDKLKEMTFAPLFVLKFMINILGHFRSMLVNSFTLLANL